VASVLVSVGGGRAWLLFLLALVEGAMSLTFLWALGLVIDGRVLVGGGLAVALLAAQPASQGFRQWLAEGLGQVVERWRGGVAIGLLSSDARNELLQRPDLKARMESLGKGGQGSVDSVYAMSALSTVLVTRAQLVGLSLALSSVRWWLGAAELLAWVAVQWWIRGEYAASETDIFRESGDARRADRLRSILLGRDFVAETRVFGAAPWLLHQYRRAWRAGMDAVWRTRSLDRSPLWLAAGTVAATALAGLMIVIGEGARGALSPGQAAFFLGLVLLGPAVMWAGDEEYFLTHSLAPIRDAMTLSRELSPARSASPPAVAVNIPMPPGNPLLVKLEDVRYSYPGFSEFVLRGVDLVVPYGQTTAIVGHNGAGKSTLLQVLLGLRAPLSGSFFSRIWTPGSDPPAVLFQSFSRWPYSLEFNVTLGRPLVRRAWLDEIAEVTGLDGVLSRLPEGWATILDPQLSEGLSLSLGEWQRVGLARALFGLSGDADLLVLDEPTSHLDPLAEQAMLEAVRAFVAGRTLLFVSHRFGTVRVADQIVVLAQGQVVETGTHEELRSAGGLYTKMFAAQSAAYAQPSAPVRETGEVP